VKVSVARTPEEVESYFQELVQLHEARWKLKHQPGSFACSRFRRLHRSLCTKLAPIGGVDLMKVTAGDETLGVFYNFIHRGTVYQYQSGVRIEKSNKLRTGVTAHVACIQHYTDHGFREYDLMAGDFAYKESLSNATRPLIWARVEGNTWKSRIVKQGKSIKATLRDLRTRMVKPKV
jgi:CelD/BcsL family acetyltransferase involved in cellulose biosynthesis